MRLWPAYVLKFAKAVEVAEGSPMEWNNPGDLTFAFGYEIVGVANAAGVLKFKEWDDGWDALCTEVSLMLSGRSHVYRTTDTIEQAGLKYSGGDPNWAKNVAGFLGVPILTTLGQCAV